MTPAGRALLVWAVIWSAIVASIVLAGVTATNPGSWMAALFMMVFFTIMSWRFIRPTLAVAPSPMAALSAIGAVAVAIRGVSEHFSVVDGVADPRAWMGLVLAVLAVALAVADPLTGVSTPMTGELIFPIREGRWRVVEGQGRILNHHWVVPEQREALDLVRISWTRRSQHGVLGGTNDDFHAFGAAVVAPCAGTVIGTHDGLTDDGREMTHPTGNHIVIDNGHEHVLLAHLRSGTVAVSPGDRVSAGDAIGEVGNSGNSTEPHLHLQASRDGQPLRLRFSDVDGRCGKGRIISTDAKNGPRQRVSRGRFRVGGRGAR